MAVHVRMAAADDIAAMHAIRLGVTANQLSDPSRLTELDYLPYIDGRGETWVALVDGRLAGFAALDCQDQSIWALFVDPAFEGQGLGKQLMARLVESARTAKMRSLSLDTTPGTRAETFYLLRGWRKAGTASNGECRLILALD